MTLGLMPNRQAIPSETQRYAYVFYLTGKTAYTQAAVTAAAKLVRLGKRDDIDIVVLRAGRLPRRYRSLLQQLGVKIHKVPRLSCKGDVTWRHSATKLHVFRLTWYQRVVYLDVDCLLLRPMDELFNFPAAEIMMPPAYWLEEQPYYTSCFMLVQPSESLWQAVYHYWQKTQRYDMVVINEALADKIVPLPDIYGCNTGDFQGPTFPRGDPEARYRRVPLVHFSSWPLAKPWRVSNHALEAYIERNRSHPRFLEIYRTWQAEREASLSAKARAEVVAEDG